MPFRLIENVQIIKCIRTFLFRLANHNSKIQSENSTSISECGLVLQNSDLYCIVYLQVSILTCKSFKPFHAFVKIPICCSQYLILIKLTNVENSMVIHKLQKYIEFAYIKSSVSLKFHRWICTDLCLLIILVQCVITL